MGSRACDNWICCGNRGNFERQARGIKRPMQSKAPFKSIVGKKCGKLSGKSPMSTLHVALSLPLVLHDVLYAIWSAITTPK
jgi:hypothetical protein